MAPEIIQKRKFHVPLPIFIPAPASDHVVNGI